MLKRYFNECMYLNPSLGSFLGFKQFDPYFENIFSIEYKIRYKELNEKYKNYIEQLQTPLTLDDKILKYTVLLNLKKIEYWDYFNYMPLTSFQNMIIDFRYMNDGYDYKTYKDIENLIYRSFRFCNILYDVINNMKKGTELNYAIPKRICSKIISMLTFFIKHKEFIVNIPEELRYSSEYNNYTEFNTFYERLLRFILKYLQDEYIHSCKDTIGYTYLPNGKDIYNFIVSDYTCGLYNAIDLHELGKDELSKTFVNLNKLRMKFGGEPYNKFFMFMNKQKICKNEVIEKYSKERKNIEKRLFNIYFAPIKETYDIKLIPGTLSNSNALAYYIPSHSKKKGTMYIHPEENTKYTVQALSLHEGVVGHHYQFQYMVENNVPLHRMYYSNNTAFVEGWALYAEDYCEITKDIDYFGKLVNNMFRSMRLIIDTGIHYYGWNYDTSFQLFKKYLPFDDNIIHAELYRYICNPGQALSYKVGELEFKKLREYYLKKDPSIINFHKTVLEDGILPLPVLKEKIDAIESRF